MTYSIRNNETGETRSIRAGRASDAAKKFAEARTTELNIAWLAEGKMVNSARVVWDAKGKYAILNGDTGAVIESFNLMVSSIKRPTAREHYIDKDAAFWARGVRQ